MLEMMIDHSYRLRAYYLSCSSGVIVRLLFVLFWCNVVCYVGDLGVVCVCVVALNTW